MQFQDHPWHLPLILRLLDLELLSLKEIPAFAEYLPWNCLPCRETLGPAAVSGYLISPPAFVSGDSESLPFVSLEGGGEGGGEGGVGEEAGEAEGV